MRLPPILTARCFFNKWLPQAFCSVQFSNKHAHHNSLLVIGQGLAMPA
jgi:hypothetical protein